MTKALWRMTALIMLSFCMQANAAIVIIRTDGSQTGPALADVSWNALAGGWDIKLLKLYNPGGDTLYTVYITGGDTINLLDINVPCWKDSDGSCVAAGSPVTVSVLHGDAAGVGTIRRIIQTGDAETLLLRAEARFDIGEIVVEYMSEIFAGRDVIGPITATTVDNPVRGVFLVTALRNVLGDIRALNGRIGGVTAYGTVGRPGANVALESKYLFFHVVGFDGIYANINTCVNGGTAGFWAMSGPIFEGSLITPRLATNTFDGTPSKITVRERFSGDLIVGGGFNSQDGWIELPKGGFDGNIIFNADNNSGSAWVNPIYFGLESDPDRITLTDTNYQVSMDVLGGGSIGLVPFRLHDVSCSPPNGASVAAGTQATPLSVRLRHYGPITWTSGDPVTIERRAAGSTGVFIPLSMLDFGSLIDPLDPNSLLVGLNTEGQGGFEPGFEYRILPTAFLKCEVSSQPSVQWTTPYLVTFEELACLGDTNSNQSVDVSDLLFLLASWGPASTFTERVDFNGDGMINVSDLLTILANWGPCF